jgi:hypothetical protein
MAMPSLDVSSDAARSQFSALVRNGWPVLFVVLLALVERAMVDLVGDVSWLITLCEKILAGQRPYIDFIETNPPAAIYMYMLPVVFSRLLGVSPEFAVGFFVFVGAAASLWASAQILRKAKVPDLGSLWRLAAFFAALLLVLPGAVFAQREHVALIAFLPYLAVALSRAHGKQVQWHWILLAGLCAGFVAIIKPHLAAGVVFTAVAAAWLGKSWRPIFALENWIAAGMLGIYGAIVVSFFPTLVNDLLPVTLAVYVPMQAPIFEFVTMGSSPLWFGAVLVALLILQKVAAAPRFAILFAASAGFAVAFFLQRKGWAYHAYPMLALSLAALVGAFLTRWPLAVWTGRKDLLLRAVSGVFIAVLVTMNFSWLSTARDTRAFVEPIKRAVQNPKIFAFSDGTDTGFPLARKVNGDWVSRTCCLWIAAGGMVMKIKDPDPLKVPFYNSFIERERLGLVEDLIRHRPDILIFERVRFDWLEWAKSDPRIARELENYAELVDINDILVLRRK